MNTRNIYGIYCVALNKPVRGILYFVDWTGLDWTCKTWTFVKRGLVKRGLVKRGLVKRGLRIGSCGRLFFLDFFRVCKSDKTKR